MSDAAWFAVRTFVANKVEMPWGPHDLQPGQIDYEERITLWHAPDIEAAIAMAEEEAQGYVEDLGGEVPVADTGIRDVRRAWSRC